MDHAQLFSVHVLILTSTRTHNYYANYVVVIVQNNDYTRSRLDRSVELLYKYCNSVLVG